MPRSVQSHKDADSSFQQGVHNYSVGEIKGKFMMEVFTGCFKITKETDKNQSAPDAKDKLMVTKGEGWGRDQLGDCD